MGPTNILKIFNRKKQINRYLEMLDRAAKVAVKKSSGGKAP